MSVSTKIAFPTPPPTTNALTSQERSQLLRTTQKLGRLLGTTPQLLEEGMPPPIPLNLQRLAVPLHMSLSSKYSDDDALVRYPSTDTVVSSSSSNSLKRNSSVSSSDSSYSTKSGFHGMQSPPSNEYWPRSDRPLLRIALKRLSKLETIPQSPPATSAPPAIYCTDHTSFTIRPVQTPKNAPPSPSFSIPSANSMRRQKMDRLRRTLGDGVPLDLVFPDEETQPVPVLRSAPPSYNEALLTPTARRPRPAQRLSAARDSLIIAPNTPHHAHRRQSSIHEPAPPSPEKKLGVIAENPDEPTVVCLPELGFASDRSSSDSEWYEGDTEAEAAQPWGQRRSDARRLKRVPVPSA
ncbi:hypothetical protein B0H10DRAFT_1956757 [Mycena sp. CBHHK59/15]|nr:hypothetical protein B0H10DRAFT_1956757 [Mycena sp. CBHHK59/15]